MARMKKPMLETDDEAKIRRALENVANTTERSDKTSWNRKMDKMVKLITELRPIEDAILELEAKKLPIHDEIQVLRTEMVGECIHPFEHLVHKDTYIECKFCSAHIGIPKNVK